MFVLCIPKPKSIADLEANKDITQNLRPPADLRKSVAIAVVDDKPFEPEHNLRNNNFQITTFSDVNRIDQLSDFPIVLCDLQGVGVHLSKDMQGAYLIEEVKRNYPEKAVIAFTGGSANSNISRRANIAADGNLRKDASIEEWREILDKHIARLSNPIEVWKQFRMRLVIAGITPLELLKIEHSYVSNIAAGPDATKKALEVLSNKSSSSGGVKKEIASFVTSKAFDLLFEALKGAVQA
ncbi:MAG: response regulator [Sideroxydans sp.]|nr:response regulator [Sideroxydans sp.]